MKQKVKEFILKFGDVNCALIAVKEIIKSHTFIYNQNKEMEWLKRPIQEWKEIKKEIEKL